MTAHTHMFPNPDPIDQKIADSERHGQRITEWQRAVMRAWAGRNVIPHGKIHIRNPRRLTSIEMGLLPIPCNCFYCGDGAVIFPPESDETWQGYCICPCCSGPDCEHKNKRRSA